MHNIILQGISFDELKGQLREIVNECFNNQNPHKQQEIDTEYLSRSQVAKTLKVSLVTLNEWTKKGIIKAYRIGNRVLYLKTDIQNSLTEVKSLKYRRFNHES
ncbi:MAG: helix-turn-helix domain-containing protein [Bacteroidetes bacterium]|nr:helix-turn-helix domain-containing protein [Bacteroidota bacterium]